MINNDIEKMVEILSTFLGEPKSRECGDSYQFQFPCPRCVEKEGENESSKNNLEINIKSSVFNCWKCSSSGDDEMKGKISKLFKLYGNEELWDAYKECLNNIRNSELFLIDFSKGDFNTNDSEDLKKSISPTPYGEPISLGVGFLSFFGAEDLLKSEGQKNLEKILKNQIKQLEEDKQTISSAITEQIGNTKSSVQKPNSDTGVIATEPTRGLNPNDIESISYNFTSANTDLKNANEAEKIAQQPGTANGFKQTHLLGYVERGLEIMYSANPVELDLKKSVLLNGIEEDGEKPAYEQQQAIFVAAKSEQKDLVSKIQSLSELKQNIDNNINKYLEHTKKGGTLTKEQSDELKRLSTLSSNLETNVSLQKERVDLLQSLIDNNSSTYKNILAEQYKYDGINRLDITVKTGLQMFAPTWDMVMDYKNGKTTREQYSNLYYKKMRKSYKIYRPEWNWLLNQEEIVLVCFCKPGDFCHRVLLAEILVKLGAEYVGEIDKKYYKTKEDDID